MKIVLKIKENVYNFMRKCGYHSEGMDERTDQLIFARRVGASDYPRFHAYLKSEDEQVIINLHLDQKKPIYKGAPAHAAEYAGPVVEEEAKRIKQIFRGR